MHVLRVCLLACLPGFVSVCLSFCLSVYLPVCLILGRSVALSVCARLSFGLSTFVCLFLRRSVWLSGCLGLSVCLYVCQEYKVPTKSMQACMVLYMCQVNMLLCPLVSAYLPLDCLFVCLSI